MIAWPSSNVSCSAANVTPLWLRELAALLKQRCGTGGTVKDGRIEIQGDQRERIVAELERLGYKVKRVGG
jgi:predicted translation initiation factor SUI1